jgi:hypothetical protein
MRFLVAGLSEILRHIHLIAPRATPAIRTVGNANVSVSPLPPDGQEARLPLQVSVRWRDEVARTCLLRRHLRTAQNEKRTLTPSDSYVHPVMATTIHSRSQDQEQLQRGTQLRSSSNTLHLSGDSWQLSGSVSQNAFWPYSQT